MVMESGHLVNWSGYTTYQARLEMTIYKIPVFDSTVCAAARVNEEQPHAHQF